jgi:hypothetical protein
MSRLIPRASHAYASPSFDGWYSPCAPSLTRFIGPVKVVSLEGKGRGLIASSDLMPGDLILVVPPLAFLKGLDGQRPDAELLIDSILENGLHKSPWLRDSLLYDGSEASLIATPDLSLPLKAAEATTSANETTKVKKLLTSKKKSAGFGAKVKAAVEGKKASETSDLPGGVDRATAKRIATCVSLNCFGDDHDDRVISALRQVPVTSHVGLWPEMCFLNHSCAPNAINYCYGDEIVIRAAQEISAGQEITISYLGRPQLDSCQTRIDKLEEDYGFTCECERCTSELIYGEKIGSAFDSLYEEVAEDLAPLFLKVREIKEIDKIEFITRRLRTKISSFLSAMQRAMLSPQVRLFFIASLYDAFEMQIEGEQLLMDLKKDPESSEEGREIIDQAMNYVLKAIQEVSPGSDLHVILAARLLARVEAAEGVGSRKAELTRELAGAAIKARYGRVEDKALLDQMISLNISLYD